MAGKGKPLKGVGTAGPYSGDIKKGGKSGSNLMKYMQLIK